MMPIGWRGLWARSQGCIRPLQSLQQRRAACVWAQGATPVPWPCSALFLAGAAGLRARLGAQEDLCPSPSSATDSQHSLRQLTLAWLCLSFPFGFLVITGSWEQLCSYVPLGMPELPSPAPHSRPQWTPLKGLEPGILI